MTTQYRNSLLAGVIAALIAAPGGSPLNKNRHRKRTADTRGLRQRGTGAIRKSDEVGA